MQTEKKVNRILIGFLVLFISTTLVLAWLYIQVFIDKKSTDLTIVTTGDKFPMSDFSKASGFPINPANVSRKIIIYMDERCRACTEHLPFIKSISNIFSDAYDFILVWENKEPKLAGGLNNSYSLHGQTRFSNVTPFVFVLDEKDVVEFSGIYDEANLTQFLLKKTAKSYQVEVVNELYRILNLQPQENHVFDFSTDGCVACQRSQDKVPILAKSTGYSYTSIVDYNLNLNSNQIYDPGIYRNILKITTFPTYCVAKNANDFLITEDIDQVLSLP